MKGSIMNNDKMIDNIKALCKKHNITITKLEEELGMSQGLISRWTKSAPSLSRIIDIADYFNVSLDEIVGRQEINKDDVITPIINMTYNNIFQWDMIDDYDNLTINNKSYDDIFDLCEDEVEIYKCNFNNSYIFLVSQYELEQGVVESLDIQLYIQADETCCPVKQGEHNERIQELWITIREQYLGVPDEIKANIVKNRIIEYGNKLTLGTIGEYISSIKEDDLKIGELFKNGKKNNLVNEDSPELDKIISIFTNPRITQAMELAERLIPYFNEIKNIKEKKDSND